MTGERIYLYDTTLRDGAQTQGVDFGASDKAAIARELDLLGIDYVEGGWPGANPTDDAFFALLLWNQLGKGYYVWDTKAEIDYLIPGISTVHGRFEVPREVAE